MFDSIHFQLDHKFFIHILGYSPSRAGFQWKVSFCAWEKSEIIKGAKLIECHKSTNANTKFDQIADRWVIVGRVGFCIRFEIICLTLIKVESIKKKKENEKVIERKRENSNMSWMSIEKSLHIWLFSRLKNIISLWRKFFSLSFCCFCRSISFIKHLFI